MNRYPLWKYLTIAVALILGFIYTLPNFFGESPAVQVTPKRTGVALTADILPKVAAVLKAAHIVSEGAAIDHKILRVRFASTDIQLKAKDVIEKALGDDYQVAFNLVPNSPAWLANIYAMPMFLGLDLRGGVHFLLEVDTDAALDKALDSEAIEIKRELRDEKIRSGSVRHVNDHLEVTLADQDGVNAAIDLLHRKMRDSTVQQVAGLSHLIVSFGPQKVAQVQADAVTQNIRILQNRINELGVAEPLIQQAGPSRIVIELPGVQDTGKAKKVIGRTATLQMRMADDEHLSQALGGSVPGDDELLNDVTAGRPILVKREVLLTGESITDAVADNDPQTGEPTVKLTLDAPGAAIFKEVSGANINKRVAMILVEDKVGQVVTAPYFRSQIGGGSVQISGAMNPEEATETAMLLRSGALSAPMKFVEERTVGPSLGVENIKRGFDSTLYGFAAITVFMMIYYRVFGVISAISLAVNLLFLIGILSWCQATLTLPGMAAIALALGMAIDSNVLINERIREELRNGSSPQMAIQAGYEHAFATILDSNITTFIAGAALFMLGSGPVKGFAMVHCLGILTSMFSAVFVSRGLVNLLHGGRRLKTLLV